MQINDGERPLLLDGLFESVKGGCGFGGPTDNTECRARVVNTFGAVGEKAQEFFKSVGTRANDLVDLVSVMGVYGSAENVLLVHSPSKMLADAAPRAKNRDAVGERPQQARAKAKAVPKKLPGKFAAGNLRNQAPKSRVKKK